MRPLLCIVAKMADPQLITHHSLPATLQQEFGRDSLEQTETRITFW